MMVVGHARTLSAGSPPLAGERGVVTRCESVIKLPLAGLRILVTRPRDQAVRLAEAIADQGGVPLLFPLLEITPVANDAALREQAARLDGFDLAIFISPNAVQFGMKAIREAGTLPARFATVGEGSAKALVAWGVNDVILPDERFDSEGLLLKLQDVAGWRVMIFRGDGGRELLGDTLKARGAFVEYATCYLRSKPQLPDFALSDADAITVTSSEALKHLQGKLCGMPLFVPHPRIAELARTLGWTEVHLTGAGDEGLLLALKQWAATRVLEGDA